MSPRGRGVTPGSEAPGLSAKKNRVMGNLPLPRQPPRGRRKVFFYRERSRARTKALPIGET